MHKFSGCAIQPTENVILSVQLPPIPYGSELISELYIYNQFLKTPVTRQ